MQNDMRFLERRSRGFATARELTDEDIAENPDAFAGASPGDLAVEQNASGIVVVMTRDAFDAHYEPDSAADAAAVALELASYNARLEELTARVEKLEADRS